MRPRSSSLDACPPYATAPLVGRRSVAAIDRSVDFPAPLGPRSATISPASQTSDTLFSARRRPKLRETSVKLSEVKSMYWRIGARGTAPSGCLTIDLGVDAFEGRDELGTARGIPLRIDAAFLVLLLDRRELCEELAALGFELVAASISHGLAAAPPARPRPRRKDRHRQRQSQVARPRRRMRKVRELERDRPARAAPRVPARRCRPGLRPSSRAARSSAATTIACRRPTSGRARSRG